MRYPSCKCAQNSPEQGVSADIRDHSLEIEPFVVVVVAVAVGMNEWELQE